MTENSKFLFGWSWTEVSVLGSQRKAVILQLVKSPKKKRYGNSLDEMD